MRHTILLLSFVFLSTQIQALDAPMKCNEILEEIVAIRLNIVQPLMRT